MIQFADMNNDIAHLLDASVLVLSFLLLSQRRLTGIIRFYRYQAFLLACACAWQAHIQDAPHLYVPAFIALTLKAIAIPFVLRKIMIRFSIDRSFDTVLGMGSTILIGSALVALSILLVFPVTMSAAALTREDLAMALSVVLLGFLIMITRHNAISQVIGFMSIENGLILAAVGVKGMPLVVELSTAFSVMVAFIIFGVFFFHMRERFDSLDIDELERLRGERPS